MKRILLVLAMGAAQMTGAGETRLAAPGLTLAATAIARGDHVRLDEVVTAPSTSLATLFLGEAPAAGASRIITRQEITLRLAQAGMREVAIEGESVRVTRGEPSCGAPADDVRVAARELPAGVIVAAADIARRKPMPGERTAGFLAEGAIVGMELAREMSAGAPFAAGSVRETVCVRKGDIIRLVSGSDCVAIAFPVRAEGNARRGEAVRVRSTRDPGSLIDAVVTGPGAARVSVGEGRGERP